MFGHTWEKASGTVVTFKPASSRNGSSGVFEFVVDVTMPEREVFRALVLEPHLAGDFNLPYPGTTVGVEVDAKTHKVRFDKSDPRLSVKARKRAEADQFEQALHQPPEPGNSARDAT